MGGKHGLTVAEAVVSLAVVVLLAVVLLPMLARQREEARRLRCQRGLSHLAQGMPTYFNEGDGQLYPWRAGRPG